MNKAISKAARRAARKLFLKAKNTTRPFTSEDYKALPAGISPALLRKNLKHLTEE